MLLDILEEEKSREKEIEKKKSLPMLEDKEPFEEYIKVHAEDEQNLLLQELDRPELPHSYRNWIGEELDRRGDNRPGIGVDQDGLPDIHWLEIPGGSVDIERAGEFQADMFFLAEYPITYLQYQAFIDDPDGFSNPAWWQGLEVEAGHKKAPGEQRFQYGNHPRDNVSWFDAVAFCRWFTEKLKSTGLSDEPIDRLKKEDWVVRLPTEWEWKMAATGGDAKNKFPWGLDWDDAKAHTKHNQLNKSIAVGLYPDGKSITGAFDMSGNVWEWCLNCYQDPEDLDLSRGDRRVLRGGSWYHWGSYAHTDMRSRYYPDHRYNAGGFRLACGKDLYK